MGCIVNGPGEAREADVGIAGGDGWASLSSKIELYKVPQKKAWTPCAKEIENSERSEKMACADNLWRTPLHKKIPFFELFTTFLSDFDLRVTESPPR